MVYKLRKGVIPVEICGEYLLVVAREAANYCPGTIQINDTAAEILNLLRQERSNDEILSYFQEKYTMENSVEEIESIEEFIRMMADKGYLLEKE